MSVINYYIVRATSNVDGAPIESVLPAEFGNQKEKSYDGKAIALDCGCSVRSWEMHVVNTPKLAEYTFSINDIPNYLSVGCENITYSNCHIVVGSNAWRGI
jgi:hypothetical protein